MFLHKLDWQRNVIDVKVNHRDEAPRVNQPVLSAMTTRQDWCTVQLYSPAVVRVDGTYHMWYVGNPMATRVDNLSLGYAESVDGLVWNEHENNPILTPADLPFGASWQTPRVLFDEARGLFRMWFVSGGVENDDEGAPTLRRQFVGYAESEDGLSWKIHPEPVYPSGRGPCVLIEEEGGYTMWMNSAPEPDDEFARLAANIFRFSSSDGLEWTRDPDPVVTAGGPTRSNVYPFVFKDRGDYTMWYTCAVEGGHCELYSSTSSDGVTWTHHRDEPSFPATRNPDDFDGRYTSTPCVLDDGDRYLLYYSARDPGNLYGAGDGTLKVDRMGIYRHIGVAVCEKAQ